MKNILFTSYIMIISLIIVSCGAMRSPNATNKPAKSTSKSKSNKIKNEEENEKTIETEEEFVRFKDTLTVVLPPIIAIDKPQGLDSDFDKAVTSFENKEFVNACQKIEVYAGIFNPTDSLYFEAKYYSSECYIVKGDSKTSIRILSNLIVDDNIPEIVREKVLVRLGQLYCINGEKQKAKIYFDELKVSFPKSIYIPLATCDNL